MNSLENEEQLKKLIDERAITVFKKSLQSDGFTFRKLTDTPTDRFQVTPMGYVNLNGTVASRPRSSVATVGQSYYATDTFIPMTYSAQGWRDGVGSIVALNN